MIIGLMKMMVSNQLISLASRELRENTVICFSLFFIVSNQLISLASREWFSFNWRMGS